MRIDGPTPNGGDYSELLYFDEKGKVLETEKGATKGVIRECKADGTLISETWLTPKQ